MTFADEIEKEAGEPIIAIVMDGHHNGTFISSPIRHIPEKLAGTVMEWKDARQYLEYEYDSSYGSVECSAITAWTENKVIVVVEYDGASWLQATQRNPVDHDPDTFGG